MKCPSCGDPKMRATATRENLEGNQVKRRRICRACGYRMTTYERAAIDTAVEWNARDVAIIRRELSLLLVRIGAPT